MKVSSTAGVSVMAKEAAQDLAHLVGRHVKVAELEIKAELHGILRRAGVVTVLAALGALGYGLSMAGLAMLIGGHASIGLPLAVIGLVHVAGAGVAFLFTPLRRRRGRLMESSTVAMTDSLAAVGKVIAVDVSASPESAHDQ